MTLLRQFFQTIWETLREIFDESAYERFLQSNRAPSGRKSYAAFCREQEIGKARRPKCC